jgi:hypothetical protein
MNNKWETAVAALLLSTLVCITACTRNVKETKILSENARYDLLIASDASEFKDGVRRKLIDRYQAQGNITVVNIGDLPQVNADAYDIIVIMDTCMAWTGFNPSFKAFLDKMDDPSKVVLLITAGDPDWTYSYGDIDAITSASRIENADDIVARLAGEIDRALESR